MKTLITLILALSCAASFGQKKTTLGLMTFEALDVNNFAEAEVLTETTKEIFVASKRYKPLDRTQYGETSKYTEIEVQKNIAFINGYVAKQGEQNGAKFLVLGKLSSVEYHDLKNGIDCTISFSISITDVETGELVASENFSHLRPIPLPDGLDKTTAMTGEINSFRNNIQNFIIANTPFFAKVISLEEVKKGGEVLLEVGEEEGVEKGSKFAIYKVTKIGKKTRKQEIVKFSIKEVQGDFSIGGLNKKETEELKAMMADPEVVLSCEEIECKFCPKLPF